MSDQAKKLRVLIVFGGQSGEHEVSIVSATHVKKALSLEKYDVEVVGITKDGCWVNFPADKDLSELDDASQQFSPVQLPSGPSTVDDQSNVFGSVDVVLPILHGPHGEDGTVQGLLELICVPYVGCGVLASAAAMDKVIAKQLFRAVGVPVVPGHLILASNLKIDRNAAMEILEEKFSFPMFVKPVNLGSSVGISKAHNHDELEHALETAAQYDRRILVEPAVANARELEVAVLGNDDPKVSVVGEIVPDREFYDYESKYSNDSTSEPVIPAHLSEVQSEEIRSLAEKAYRVIDGAGLARVDFLMNGETGEFFVNEVNTLPGFTPISMYPKLWESSGISYAELLDQLILLAIERAEVKRVLRTSK